MPNRRQFLIVLAVLFVLAISVTPMFAQSIEFDPAELINQANNWISTFLPILSIGFGISIALALIALVGGQIVKALRTAGGSGK